MQNWDHVKTLFSSFLNKMPKEYRDADITRIRFSSLSEQAAYLRFLSLLFLLYLVFHSRVSPLFTFPFFLILPPSPPFPRHLINSQTLIFSEVPHALLNSLYTKSALNVYGRFKVHDPCENGEVVRVGVEVRQFYQQLNVKNVGEVDDKRFEYFTKEVPHSFPLFPPHPLCVHHPIVLESLSSLTLLGIPTHRGLRRNWHSPLHSFLFRLRSCEKFPAKEKEIG